MKGETVVRQILEPTLVRMISGGGAGAHPAIPLQINHNPTEGNTIKLVASSPATEAIAYALRVATP